MDPFVGIRMGSKMIPQDQKSVIHSLFGYLSLGLRLSDFSGCLLADYLCLSFDGLGLGGGDLLGLCLSLSS